MEVTWRLLSTSCCSSHFLVSNKFEHYQELRVVCPAVIVAFLVQDFGLTFMHTARCALETHVPHAHYKGRAHVEETQGPEQLV